MAEANAKAAEATLWQRVRAFALGVLFATVLLIPKMLELRRRRRAWNSMRVATIAAGLVLAGAAWARETGWGWGAVGIVTVLLAVIIGPVKREKTVDEQAKEFGALVTMNGGELVRGNIGTRTNLFVCAEGLKVCDLRHRGLGEIAFQELAEVRAAADGEQWKLLLVSSGATWEFRYDGAFAEHLARVAETSIRSQWKKGLAVIR